MRIIGVGNQIRRDDGAGIEVVHRLKALLPDADIRTESGEMASLMEAMSGCEEVLIIDACQSGNEAGTVHHFDVSEIELPADVRQQTSSHGFGPAEAIEMARALGTLPPRVKVVLIEAADMDHGEGLSKAVEQAVERVVGEISRLEEVK